MKFHCSCPLCRRPILAVPQPVKRCPHCGWRSCACEPRKSLWERIREYLH